MTGSGWPGTVHTLFCMEKEVADVGGVDAGVAIVGPALVRKAVKPL